MTLSLQNGPAMQPERSLNAPPARSPRTRRELAQRVRELGPELDAHSSTFEAAMVVMATSCTERNVDKLARVTGLQRDFVARCARRLVDGDLWSKGGAVAATNGDPDPFWTAVAVAEGKLCRYLGEGDRVFWGEPGQWRTLYAEEQATPAPSEEWTGPAAGGFPPAEEPGFAPVEGGMVTPRPRSASRDPGQHGGEAGWDPRRTGTSTPAPISVLGVFPGATWLG